jgi:predicted benzoate:H+ symporter BenE
VGVWKHVSARSGREFVKHVVPAVLKPARTLWNEIIGFFFICLAVYCGSGVVRSYMRLGAAQPDQVAGAMVALVMSVFCTILMLYFGITSFLRARKISRS